MLSKNFFQAGRLLASKPSSVVVTRNMNFRPPPPIPQFTDNPEQGREFNPNKESLESYLNLRFGHNFPTINDDKNPQRDLTNFPRPVRQDFAEPTRLGIIPESWFTAFYEKTGVTGPYAFFGGFLTFLLSKEWLVFEHELLVGIEATIIIVLSVKMFGKNARQKQCEEIQKSEDQWMDWQKGMMTFLNEFIEIEKNLRDAPQHHKVLFDAKRENIQLQLEAEYRRRQMEAFNEVRRRLNYLVAKEEAQKYFQQRHMVDWIIDNVAKSITGAQEKEALKTTLAELKKLSNTVSI